MENTCLICRGESAIAFFVFYRDWMTVSNNTAPRDPVIDTAVFVSTYLPQNCRIRFTFVSKNRYGTEWPYQTIGPREILPLIRLFSCICITTATLSYSVHIHIQKRYETDWPYHAIGPREILSLIRLFLYLLPQHCHIRFIVIFKKGMRRHREPQRIVSMCFA